MASYTDPDRSFAAYPESSADFEEGDVGIAIRSLCPLIQVFDMPTSLRFYARGRKAWQNERICIL